MNYAIGFFGKDDHLVLRLLTQLAHPARPAIGCAFHYLLCALPLVCSSQGKYEQGEYDVHPRVFKAGKISVQLLLQGLHISSRVRPRVHLRPLNTFRQQ